MRNVPVPRRATNMVRSQRTLYLSPSRPSTGEKTV
jgi:hypothetical protein